MRDEFEFAGRYVLQVKLGNGAVGEVWRAYDRDLDRTVAVKVIWEHITDPELARGFQREARLAARLQHPGITVVHDVGEHDGQPFIVMELLRGRDLQAVLREAPAGLPVGTVISLAIQAAEALEAAHAGHVIHRDLKPENLFLQDSGQLKMCDFGIAVAGDATMSITAGSYILGTPAYMSPEQCDGKQADERSDLYSLGCVIYALLTGQPPFRAGPPLAIMAKHRTEAPAPPGRFRPDVPPDLAALVLALLAKDPASRPSAARHVAATLKSLPRPTYTNLPDEGWTSAHRQPPKSHPGAARTSWPPVSPPPPRRPVPPQPPAAQQGPVPSSPKIGRLAQSALARSSGWQFAGLLAIFVPYIAFPYIIMSFVQLRKVSRFEPRLRPARRALWTYCALNVFPGIYPLIIEISAIIKLSGH